MGFRLLIARRYLASRRRVTLISVITGTAVSGVALGVASLIVVLSVMNGFYDLVQGLLVSLDPHVRIVSAEAEGIAAEDIPELVAVASEQPFVEEVGAYVEGKALLLHQGPGEANRVVVVRGIEPARAERLELVRGTSDLEGRGVLIGSSLGEQLALMPAVDRPSESRIALVSAAGISQLMARFFAPPPVERYEVRGHFRQEPSYARTNVFVSLADAQRLFGLGGAASGIELRLSDINQAAPTRDRLERALVPGRYKIATWYDLQRSLYDVMRLEKWGATLVLLLIMVVAAFTIVGSLSMVVMEKRRDIGVIQAMGVGRRGVRQIFLLEGALIGLLGTGLGFLVGLGVALAQQQWDLVPLVGAESFVVAAYPVAIQWVDLLMIGFVSMGLCLLAALYPAHRASRLLPARALQTHR